nr:menaquinone-dependent protoporphyrinogen IX dehydrogenase [Vibrio agarilyticus]
MCLYSSREGQTRKILAFIQEQLPEYDFDILNLHEHPTVEFSRYDKVLVGASIRYGHLNKALYQFIARYYRELTQVNAAFFCVNLTARKEAQGKDTPEGSAYIRTFLSKSQWQPKMIGVFAGALYYPRYGWFDKMMIKFIMTMTGGETDTNKEVEYTNWEKVAIFAKRWSE